MKIAVLGWGSLIWDPQELQIRDEWYVDGPQLPIEFARISHDGRLTLVLLPRANPVTVLWAFMTIKNLDEAIENLRDRENTSVNNIGFVITHTSKHKSNIVGIQDGVRSWASAKDIDAVIWTDLPSKFENIEGQPLNIENIISYLNSLHDQEKLLAEQYIRKAPVQIRTEFRTCIEEELGWTAIRESEG